MKARVLLIVSLCALLPATAMSQALTSLASVRVGYNSRKNTVKPQGELKAQIDQLQRHAGPTSADGDLERERAKAQDDLDSAQERLARAQRRLDDLQDEVRRKGLPPDWLR